MTAVRIKWAHEYTRLQMKKIPAQICREIVLQMCRTILYPESQLWNDSWNKEWKYRLPRGFGLREPHSMVSARAGVPFPSLFHFFPLREKATGSFVRRLRGGVVHLLCHSPRHHYQAIPHLQQLLSHFWKVFPFPDVRRLCFCATDLGGREVRAFYLQHQLSSKVIDSLWWRNR